MYLPHPLPSVATTRGDDSSLRSEIPECHAPCLPGTLLGETLCFVDGLPTEARERSPSDSTTEEGRLKRLAKWHFPTDASEEVGACPTESGAATQRVVPHLDAANRQSNRAQKVTAFHLYTSDAPPARRYRSSSNGSTMVDEQAAWSATATTTAPRFSVGCESPMMIGRHFSLRIVTGDDETMAETSGLLDLQAVDKERSDSDVSFELDAPLLTSIVDVLSTSTASRIVSSSAHAETPTSATLETSHSDFIRLLQARKAQENKPLLLVTSPRTFTARVKQRFAERREQWRQAEEKKQKLKEENREATSQPTGYLAHLTEREHIRLRCNLTEFLLKYVVHSPL